MDVHIGDLDAQSRALLREVLQKRAPDLLSIAEDPAHLITESESDRLLLEIGQELVATGFDSNDEPNERGLSLERLLDNVNILKYRDA